MGYINIKLRIKEIPQASVTTALAILNTAIANLVTSSGKEIDVEQKEWIAEEGDL